MTRITSRAAVGAIFLCQFAVTAQSQEPTLQEAPEPPELPRQVQSGETLEPDVTIIRRRQETVTEYRVNGKLRAIKVQPRNAPAYYLVDADGDGTPESRRDGFGEDILIPQWVIFSW